MKLRPIFRAITLLVIALVTLTYLRSPRPHSRPANAKKSLGTAAGRAEMKSLIRDAVPVLAWGKLDTLSVVVYRKSQPSEYVKEWQSFLDLATKSPGGLANRRYAVAEIQRGIQAGDRVAVRVEEFRVSAAGKHIHINTHTLTLIFKKGVWMVEKFSSSGGESGRPAINPLIAGL